MKNEFKGKLTSENGFNFVRHNYKYSPFIIRNMIIENETNKSKQTNQITRIDNPTSYLRLLGKKLSSQRKMKADKYGKVAKNRYCIILVFTTEGKLLGTASKNYGNEETIIETDFALTMQVINYIISLKLGKEGWNYKFPAKPFYLHQYLQIADPYLRTKMQEMLKNIWSDPIMLDFLDYGIVLAIQTNANNTVTRDRFKRFRKTLIESLHSVIQRDKGEYRHFNLQKSVDLSYRF